MKINQSILPFRAWCSRLWEENCIEREGFREPCMDLSQYFNTYKYWLKREYKFQKSKSQ